MDCRYILESTPREGGKCIQWLNAKRLQFSVSLPSRRYVWGLAENRIESTQQNTSLVGMFYMMNVNVAQLK